MNLQNVLNFLSDLKENNNREWFGENKSRFLDAKADFENLVADLIKEISKFDSTISTLTPKDCIFRIYRDVRFSKDKSPYKMNFGAAFNKGGKKYPSAAYYIHLEPDNSFVGGGMWMPRGDVLKAVRSEIFYNPQEFKKIINASSFKKIYNELMGDKLKRPPQGFQSDFPDIELLKYKSYVVGHNVSDKDVLSTEFIGTIPGYFKVLNPFIEFLNRSLD